MRSRRIIQVFEHQSIRKDEVLDGTRFEQAHLEAFERYYGTGGCPYFSLIHNGVKFNEHVGVLQVGNLTIEVLPKADKQSNDKATWHAFLVDMLRFAGVLDVSVTGNSPLRVKSNSIFELYIELFLNEVIYLMHTGLVKKYRRIAGNSYSLKGALLFSKHLQRNLIHKERFHVSHTIYDKDNVYNKILFKTIRLIKHINTSGYLNSNIDQLVLNFPECEDLNVTETLFAGIKYDRKTEGYRKAIGMARMILMNYHPDIRSGQNDVLALMFDMNSLWEVYVAKTLKRVLRGRYLIKEQVKTEFWMPQAGRVVRVIPDIVVYDLADTPICVLDTKWKDLSGHRPGDDDLKQMLIYNLYKDCQDSALVYPSVSESKSTGWYQKEFHGSCSLLFLPLVRNEMSYKLNIQPLVSFITEAERRTPVIKQ